LHTNPGRFINHVAKNPNVRLWPLLEVRGRLRMGFVSFRDIAVGEELAWDYSVWDREMPFLKSGRFEEGRVVSGTGEGKTEGTVPRGTGRRLKTG